jgi:hypothetical protein
MRRTFAITALADKLRLNTDGIAQATFTVTNTSDRPTRAQIKIRPLDSSPTEWFALTGDAERTFQPKATEDVVVDVRVPHRSSVDRCSFRVDVISIEDPDDDYSEGPSVLLERALATPAPSKPFPWWILVAACLGLVVVSGAIYFLLRQSDPISPPEPVMPVANILLIGHQDHGKTTLASAISWVLSKRGESTFVAYEAVGAKTPPQVEFTRNKLKYRIFDFATDEEILKFIASGNPKMVAVVLVVSGQDGPMPQTRSHLVGTREKALNLAAVFVNKVDVANDKELLDLVELELRELLKALGFSGDEPIIRGSALKALQSDQAWEKSIMELVAAIEKYVEKNPPTGQGNGK